MALSLRQRSLSLVRCILLMIRRRSSWSGSVSIISARLVCRLIGLAINQIAQTTPSSFFPG